MFTLGSGKIFIQLSFCIVPPSSWANTANIKLYPHSLLAHASIKYTCALNSPSDETVDHNEYDAGHEWCN